MSDPSKQSLNNNPLVPNQTFAMMPSQISLNSVDRMQGLQDFTIGLSSQSFQVPYGTSPNMYMYQDNQFPTRGSMYVKEEKDLDLCPSTVLHSRPLSAPESGSSPKTFVAFSPGGSDQEKSDKLGAFADLVLGLDKGMSPLSVVTVSNIQDGGHPSPAGSSTGHQAVLRYQPSRDAMLSAINYSDSVILQEGGPFDVNVGSLSTLEEGLIGNLGVSNTGGSTNSGFDLFDGDTGQDSYMEANQDLQLSPHTFNNNPDSFNDNSNLSSINDSGVDNAGSNEETKSTDLSKLSLDKSRIKNKPAKATSPNRQGVQACFQCGKVFSNSSALAKHKLTHSDERKYVCQLCSKAFKRQDHLNGHMLTHRKKKPYECKVEGCGKSYCDARSLRRHTENHHSSSSSGCISVPVTGISVPVTCVTAISQSGGLRAAIGLPHFTENKLDVSNSFVTKPAISNRIQYAPPSPSPYNSSNAVSNASSAPISSANDASSTTTAAEQLQILAFQQPTNNLLNWSHQQTQQSQQQQYLNQQVFRDSCTRSPQSGSDGYLLPQTSTTPNPNCSPIHTPHSQHSDVNLLPINEGQILRMTLPQVSSIEQQNSLSQDQAGSLQQNSQLLAADIMMHSPQHLQQMQTTLLAQQTQAVQSQQQRPAWVGQVPTYNLTQASTFTQEPKPAECPLCHRKFKNVPALNGHMRLHGGYFKRDADPNKKSEKKSDASGQHPPLQTASMNVRALIEEKIIQKRIVNPQVYSQPLENFNDMNHPHQFLISPMNEGTSADPVMNLDLPEGLPMDVQEDLMNIRQGLLSQQPLPPEKLRRHSDSDHFLAPRRPAASSALVDLLRRRVAGKRAQRTGSDPGECFLMSGTIQNLNIQQQLQPPILPLSPCATQSPLHSPLLQPTTPVSIPNSPTIAQWPHNQSMDCSFSNEPLPQQQEQQLMQQPIRITTPIPPSGQTPPMNVSPPPAVAIANLTVPKLHLDREDDDDVFLNPSSIPASPMRSKKKHRPEPLFIPPHVNTSMNRFPSQLRSPRLWDPNSEGKTGSPPPYTPPPMLSPVRSGSGLFWHILSSGSVTPKSAPITPRFGAPRTNSTEGFPVEEEEICDPPETDVQPHVNIGSQFQAILPVCRVDSLTRFSEPDKADLMWDPKVERNAIEEDIEAYLEFACCAAIPGGGRNKEFALFLLFLNNGNLHQALLQLMDPTPKLPKGHHLLTYPFPECDIWSSEEIEAYNQALNKCDKDFFAIAQEVDGKSVRQCIQFYYLWKKVCPEEYKRHRLIRRKREQENIMYNLRSKGSDVELDLDGFNPGSPFNLTDASNDRYVCEYPDCTATFISRQALNGHVRVHGGGGATTSGSKTQNGPNHSPGRDNMDVVKSYSSSQNTSSSNATAVTVEEFPCKICGKVFPKVKSRSAHMKSHRQQDNDKYRMD